MSDSLCARRHCFVVEAADEFDAVIRVLTPFAVQAAQLASVTMERGPHGVRIRIEADGLSSQRAETLVQRLRAMRVVLGVAIGWRQAARAAA
ncbi:hypothetical protein [Phenylobacterium sp.]|uniref:hypothetical protein n=1 Tax=Phenylobacterium sp. TaxID=1871053 RepID=UPI003D26C516